MWKICTTNPALPVSGWDKWYYIFLKARKIGPWVSQVGLVVQLFHKGGRGGEGGRGGDEEGEHQVRALRGPWGPPGGGPKCPQANFKLGPAGWRALRKFSRRIAKIPQAEFWGLVPGLRSTPNGGWIIHPWGQQAGAGPT